MKMREKEAEMRSYFEVPRPKEIDFSDIPRDSHPRTVTSAAGADDNGDSPLATGDDMDKLIAERIASRERDLAEITQQIKRSAAPTASDQPSNDIMIMRKPAPALEHKVRFDETPDIIQDNDPHTDINAIFMKLKRKPDGGGV